MKLLLDTHTLLWSLSDTSKLSNMAIQLLKYWKTSSTY
jgi:PIN domain nuclease of toxin-antitoxin system